MQSLLSYIVLLLQHSQCGTQVCYAGLWPWQLLQLQFQSAVVSLCLLFKKRKISLNSIASPKRGVANSDDIAVFEYTEAVPDTMDKREDGDDRVVFSWAAPESKEKREDGDDQVVYTWAVPDAAD